MTDPAPTAGGTLTTTSFGQLLASLLERRLSGTLVLQHSDGRRSAVLFERGAPAKAKTAEPIEPLGRVLLEQGALSDEIYDQSLALLAKERRLHGALLVEHRWLTPEALQRGLEEQLLRKLLWLHSVPPQTLWAFYEGRDFLARWGAEPTRIEPLTVLWRGARLHAREEELERELAALGERLLRLRDQVPLGRFRFTPEEQAIVDVLRARPQPLAQLAASGVAPRGLVRRLVYTLALTRALELDGHPQPPRGVEAPATTDATPRTPTPAAAPVRPAPAEPGASPAAPARPAAEAGSAPPEAAPGAPARGGLPAQEREEELHRLLAEQAGKSHYGVLGVPSDASPDRIQAAFFTLAKRYHPDRVAVGTPELKELATRVFARINEAFTTLSSVEGRREYDHLLEDARAGEGGEEQVQRVLAAVAAYQRAEVHAKRQQLDQAIEAAQQAMEGDPTQGEYVVFHAWLASQRRPAPSPEQFSQWLGACRRIVSQEPQQPKLLYWYGQLLQRAGKPAEAISTFKKVVALRPQHIEAQRELRLHEMRSSKATTSTEPGEKKASLFDRFRKR